MNKIVSGIHVEVKESEEDRVLNMIGSTNLIDRHGEVIDNKGWELENYKKNPVILFAHDSSQPPVAKAIEVGLEKGKLKFKIKFPDEGVYPFADTIYKLYKGGFMKASSVGFMPIEWKDGDGTEKSPWRTYTKAELLELSLVPVPANPQALVTSKELKKAYDMNVIDQDEWTKFCEVVKTLEEPEDETNLTVETNNEIVTNLKSEIKEKIFQIKNLIKELEKDLDEDVSEDCYFEILQELRTEKMSKSNTDEEILDAVRDLGKEIK